MLSLPWPGFNPWSGNYDPAKKKKKKKRLAVAKEEGEREEKGEGMGEGSTESLGLAKQTIIYRMDKEKNPTI